MKPEIRRIVTRSALFFGILAVSAAGMQLAAWRNAQNVPDAVTASADQSPVIVLDAGQGEDNARGTLPLENVGAFRYALIDFSSLLCYNGFTEDYFLGAIKHGSLRILEFVF